MNSSQILETWRLAPTRSFQIGWRCRLLSTCMFVAVAISPAADLHAADAPTISVVAAREQRIERTATVVGTIVPKETTLVNVDLDGARIETILVEEGNLVSRGQVLATLDSAKLDVELLQNDAQKDSAEAQVGQALSALETALITRNQADVDLRRAEKLNGKGLLSHELFEQRQNALAQAAAAVNAARQAIKVAEAQVKTIEVARKDIELRLRRTTILSPSAGRILTRTAKVGAIASSSGQPLFVLANDDAFELEVEIPQSQHVNIAVAARASVSAGDGQPDIEGVVRFIAPTLADGTRLGRARISLPHRQPFPVGAFAAAQIEVGNDAGIFLPSSVITGTESDPAVKIIRENRIEQKSVSLGLRQSGLVHIRAGLSEGDLIVLKAGSYMNVGDSAVPYQVSLGISPGRAASAGGN